MVKIYPDDPKTIARMQSRIQVHTTGGSLSLASIKLDNGTELLSIGMESSEGNIVYTLDLDEFSSALEALKEGRQEYCSLEDAAEDPDGRSAINAESTFLDGTSMDEGYDGESDPTDPDHWADSPSE